jgi:hypothetical protein
MKTRWKRLFLWSSLGSVAVGVSVAFVRKARKKPDVEEPEYEFLPGGAVVDVRTRPFRTGKPPVLVQDRYLLQATAFKVWSVIDLSVESAGGNAGGATIYHVTHSRRTESAGADSAPEQVLERFYATVRSVDSRGRAHKNRVAPGTMLELPRCYVGGTSNGIESGEVHRSGAPTLDYDIQRAGEDGSAEKSSL